MTPSFHHCYSASSPLYNGIFELQKLLTPVACILSIKEFLSTRPEAFAERAAVAYLALLSQQCPENQSARPQGQEKLRKKCVGFCT